MFDLNGKVAIITGGSSGIGAAAVRMFHQLGAKVTIGDIQVEAGEALATELGDGVRFSRLDVTDRDDWERAVADTEADFGPVSVLVNNAGHSGFQKSLADLSYEEFRHVCAINQDGVFMGMKLVVPSMLRAGGGSIVNNSSGWGLVGAANVMDYCASKFAVTGMTKAAAIELATSKIRRTEARSALQPARPNRSMPGIKRGPRPAVQPARKRPGEVARLQRLCRLDPVGHKVCASRRL